MKSLLKYCSFGLSILLISSCAAEKGEPTLKALWLDRQAKQNLEKKQYEPALDTYYKMLETDPELAEVHSNIAVMYINGKKTDDALKSLQQALKLAIDHKDLKIQFAVQYNLGVLYGAQKKVPEALEHYQAALDILPTSKETKTNIELLIQSNSSDKSKDGENKDSDSKDGQSKDKKDSKDGKGDQKDKDKKEQDKKDQEKKDQEKKEKDKKDGEDDKDKKEDQPKDKPKQAEQSAKYKPRPFQGDQLSEGDVKKILGELKNQEQKIRANFEKKERKENKNEKDW